MGKWVNFLVLVLLLSISTQALSLVFDTHVAHQDSDSHLSETTHDAKVTKASNSTDGLVDNSGLDCQHCCHCHSAPHIFVPLLIKALPSEGHYSARHNLAQPPAEGYWRNLLRPPIA